MDWRKQLLSVLSSQTLSEMRQYNFYVLELRKTGLILLCKSTNQQRTTNKCQGFRKLSSDTADKQTSYEWSLPVTWQRWRSHHSIRCNQKPHVHANLMTLSAVEPESGVMSDRNLHCGNKHFEVTNIMWTSTNRTIE